MITRVIAWSARNLLLVLFGTGLAAAAGIYALVHLPLDAIPDLSDTQVIVYTEYAGQAPQVIEDQVTYPLTTAMLTVPKSKVVRGFSFFGVSFVYVIFEDGTDIYWARSRVLEFLNAATQRLPAGVTPTIGPDATGVGWVYQYAVMSKELNLADTRTIQDWNLKFALSKAEGVAEVASVGGFVKQYNVVLDPQRMRDLGITMQKIRDAIRASMPMSAAAPSSCRNSSMLSAAGAISEVSTISATLFLRTMVERRFCCGTCPGLSWGRMSGVVSPNSTGKERSRAESCCSDSE
jgi:copper/silver efflux system protein